MEEFLYSHLLSIILFTPAIGALLMIFIPREMENTHRVAGNVFGFLGFLVSLPLLTGFTRLHPGFNPGLEGFQFVEHARWIDAIGASYTLGIDGISLMLIMLTTSIGAIAILSSWNAIQTRVKEYYILLLLLQAGMLGAFMALDFFLFYVFWEIMLVPMYFLIGVWGSDRRLYAAIKFFLYTLAGSVLMLLAILSIYFNHATMHSSPLACPAASMFADHAKYTFDYQVLALVTPHFAFELQQWLFWGLFFAFAIKVPMFPFHTWLPDAHTEAPTAGSVILAGVLLKMGTYGFLRFSVPLLPDASKHYASWMVWLSIFAIIYGALVCMMQKDMKKLIAYSSVSHMGFCTLGIFALTPMGIGGSVLQQINHGISTGALFLIVGVLYERRHTRLISEFGGLSTPMPNFATAYLIISLSSLGMPLLNGFIGEFAILRGVFEVRHGDVAIGQTWAAWGAIGIVLGAAYLLWLYQRVMFGNVTNPHNTALPDLNAREFATLLPLIVMAFWIGIYPKPFFEYLEPPIKQIVMRLDPNYYKVARLEAPKPASHASPQGEAPAAGHSEKK